MSIVIAYQGIVDVGRYSLSTIGPSSQNVSVEAEAEESAMI